MRLAVLTDTHFHHDRLAAIGTRRAGIADLLLLRAVHRLNRYVCPDLTVLLGDVVNDGTLPEADAQFHSIRRTLDLLRMPWLALPGNHDGDPERFYRHFPRPADAVDVAGVRFLPFVDAEEPGYNARRSPHDIERMRASRTDGWRGPVVMLQHVPLFPPGAHACPYNYVNADALVRDMEQAGIQGAVSGHYHAGFLPLRHRTMDFVAAPALCEAPFGYLILEITPETIRAERQVLAMPPELGLTDVHVHTHLAYCNENMDIPLARSLASDFGLAGLRFTEHSGHLYFSRQDYGARCFRDGLASASPEANRMPLYAAALAGAGVAPADWGIEIDADFAGNPLLRPEDSGRFPFRVGAMHGLQSLHAPQADSDAAGHDFLAVLQRFLKAPLAVLAHPFRVFRRAGRPTPSGLIAPTVRLLREHGVAAEINFHTNEPDPLFVRLCIDAGVPLAFGSDAHNLYEVGEFFPHLQILRRAGYDGDPRDVLLQP